jgi:hypothetical protein
LPTNLFPWLRQLFADSAYAGDKLRKALANSAAEHRDREVRESRPLSAVNGSTSMSYVPDATAASPRAASNSWSPLWSSQVLPIQHPQNSHNRIIPFVSPRNARRIDIGNRNIKAALMDAEQPFEKGRSRELPLRGHFWRCRRGLLFAVRMAAAELNNIGAGHFDARHSRRIKCLGLKIRVTAGRAVKDHFTITKNSN